MSDTKSIRLRGMTYGGDSIPRIFMSQIQTDKRFNTRARRKTESNSVLSTFTLDLKQNPDSLKNLARHPHNPAYARLPLFGRDDRCYGWKPVLKLEQR